MLSGICVPNGRQPFLIPYLLFFFPGKNGLNLRFHRKKFFRKKKKFAIRLEKKNG
jgi:hypothetical protein